MMPHRLRAHGNGFFCVGFPACLAAADVNPQGTPFRLQHNGGACQVIAFPPCSRRRQRTKWSFPAPWRIEDKGACFIVKDQTAKLLTSEEAQRIAATITKLPDLLRNEMTR